MDLATFDARAAAGGFLEHAEFLGEHYGTPVPDDLPEGKDLLLEIDVQGAAQVKQRAPDALLILLVAPTRAAQEERLRGRGDPPDAVERRLAKGDEEVQLARQLGLSEGAVISVLSLLAQEGKLRIARVELPRRDDGRQGQGRISSRFLVAPQSGQSAGHSARIALGFAAQHVQEAGKWAWPVLRCSKLWC